tara:strand:+ start:828 stop:1034 length:207 start_codon:yes stop_codon:yes gene_type:complete
MDKDMENFVGYRKERTVNAISTPISRSWLTMERGVLLLNTSIVILGVLMVFIVSDISEGPSITSAFGC